MPEAESAGFAIGFVLAWEQGPLLRPDDGDEVSC